MLSSYVRKVIEVAVRDQIKGSTHSLLIMGLDEKLPTAVMTSNLETLIQSNSWGPGRTVSGEDQVRLLTDICLLRRGTHQSSTARTTLLSPWRYFFVRTHLKVLRVLDNKAAQLYGEYVVRIEFVKWQSRLKQDLSCVTLEIAHDKLLAISHGG